MIQLRHVFLVGALLGLTTATAQAGIVGSLALNGRNIVPVKGDPLTTNIYTNSDTVTNASGSGIFSGVGILTSFGSLTIDVSQASPKFGFTLSNASVGTFVANTGVLLRYTVGKSHNMTLSVDGIFTPTVGAARNFTASISFTQSSKGSDVSQAISIDVAAVPEPSSIALGAIGLVSVGLVALRKRRSSK